MKLGDIDLNNLDFNNLGNWPWIAKSVVIVVVCAILIGLGYFLDTSGQLTALDSSRKQEEELKQLLEIKQAKAANLTAYEKQMREIEQSFGSLLRQLPSRTEVADLLTDITQTGLAAGLEFELFKPKTEVPEDFYAELPIEIRVRGKYHEFGQFIGGIASLPRIVTLNDFDIKVDPKNEKGDLIMSATAKTYRYLDEKEIQQLSGK